MFELREKFEKVTFWPFLTPQKRIFRRFSLRIVKKIGQIIGISCMGLLRIVRKSVWFVAIFLLTLVQNLDDPSGFLQVLKENLGGSRGLFPDLCSELSKNLGGSSGFSADF